MSKSAFKRIIKTPEKKAAPAPAVKPWEISTTVPAADIVVKEPSDGFCQKDENVCTVPVTCSSQTGVKIYTDVSVCRALNIRRRILAEAKTAESRGTDWDSVGEECGMTMDWIEKHASIAGVGHSWKIMLEECSGRFVSVKLVGTTPNRGICLAETVANGKREFVRIRNIIEHPIHYKEHFDCVRCSDHLEWTAAPNNARY